MSFWACARTEPRREAVAARFLGLAGYRVYVPRIREQRLKGGRRIVTVAPLFPSYCFIAIETGWHRARWSIGVAALIMNGTGPALVRDEIIDAIREREIRGAIELPKPPLIPGVRVRIVAGQLSGIEGLYAGMKSRERVEVLLALLGGQQRVTLPRDDLENALSQLI
jgi:transcription antitermination factor NusG